MNVFRIRYSIPASDRSSAAAFAEKIAFGQTLGFASKDPAYADYHGRVYQVEEQGEDRFNIDIDFPNHLFASDIAGLLTVAFGKISFAPGIRLEGLDWVGEKLPFVGPKFGDQGIRKKLARNPSVPLMAILKPGIGPSQDTLVQQVVSLADTGVDLVKDDEVLIEADGDAAIGRAKMIRERTQGRILYVQHLTGKGEGLRERALRLQDAGTSALLFCPYTYGLSMLQSLAEDPALEVAIFAHPALSGTMMHPQAGMAPSMILGTLLRLAGADAVLYPSPYGSISLEFDDAMAIHRQLQQPWHGLKPAASIPSAGITAAMVSNILQDFSGQAFVNAGTGLQADGNLEGTVGAFKKAITECKV